MDIDSAGRTEVVGVDLLLDLKVKVNVSSERYVPPFFSTPTVLGLRRLPQWSVDCIIGSQRNKNNE